MRQLIVIPILLAFVLPCYAADYITVTKDDEVTQLTSVEVKKSTQETIEKTYTLQEIDNELYNLSNQIEALYRQITSLEAKINELKAIRTLVEVEARKIKLKKIPKRVEKPIE